MSSFVEDHGTDTRGLGVASGVFEKVGGVGRGPIKLDKEMASAFIVGTDKDQSHSVYLAGPL